MADPVWVLREVPAPIDEFSGQLAALQCAFDNYKESAFSVDTDSGRSKKKESKKKKKDGKHRRGRSGDSESPVC